ncbi:Uu.00g041390.m01.CDS01 [Anthostomella pinea]|uniref:Uu.00g041390.m01.CDS01 n=1 Tax=Anthostomella pinea TaxID=933095 RepID=A0AAI8YDX7_9PEZI|nr:Uu.00g041390.m01.CDS01 [Anthostomella pinea]
MSDAAPREATNSEGPSSKKSRAENAVEPHILAKYHPDLIDYVQKMIASGAAQHEVPIEELRANPSKYAPPWSKDVTGWERVADDEVVSEDGAKVPVKIYHPDPSRFGDGPYGAHLNFHGGGFVLGDLTTESQLCLSMRDGAGVVVIDVNYRHCPETFWGQCIQDAWAALKWTRDSASRLNINPNSVSIGGISAGGHISIILQHLARDGGIPLKLCLATVPPSTAGLQYEDYTESPFPSFSEFAHGPILPWKRIHFFGKHCFPRDKLEEYRNAWPNWWFAPLDADNWSGLCPTFIRTAECDPLRDEGEAYGLQLVSGGTKVCFKRYLGCPHLFMYFDWFAVKKQYDLDSIAALREAHGTR